MSSSLFRIKGSCVNFSALASVRGSLKYLRDKIAPSNSKTDDLDELYIPHEKLVTALKVRLHELRITWVAAEQERTELCAVNATRLLKHDAARQSGNVLTICVADFEIQARVPRAPPFELNVASCNRD